MFSALVGFAVLLALIFARVPIALAMGLVGFFGFAHELGLTPDNAQDFKWSRPLSAVAQKIYDTATQYGLSVIPLFLLMGNLIARAGVARKLYDASNAFLGHRPGGLAAATIVACGGFSAICGSSLATAATMSKVAVPAMRRFGYHDSLSTAAVAAGGTLGILIPPSVILVIYGIITQTSIRELFAAGLIPGVIGVLFYIGAVRYVVWRRPESGPAGEKTPWRARLRALSGARGALGLFVMVMGGIYAGIFTPTEAAGMGAAGAFLLSLRDRRRAGLSDALFALRDAVRVSAMLFSLLIGAMIFAVFVNRAGMPDDLVNFIRELRLSPLTVIALMMVVYIGLGMVFESLSMLLLTVPVFFPVVQALGYDPVWFGVIAVAVTEISLITPPVGLNVFVLAGSLGNVKTSVIFRGVTPFWVADILRLAALVLFPVLSLAMPMWLYR